MQYTYNISTNKLEEIPPIHFCNKCKDIGCIDCDTEARKAEASWQDESSELIKKLESVKEVHVKYGKEGEARGVESAIRTVKRFLVRNSHPKPEGKPLSEITDSWVDTRTMPDFDGDYLCHIVKKEQCGAFNKYQRVVNCHFNQWVTLEGERVTHWQKLPMPPNSTVHLI